MNKKILIIISIVIAAIVIPFGIYAISPLYSSNTVNEPLPTTAVGVNKNTALHTYQEFVSMNNQDRIIAAKQMSQREKNMVMIGAAQINNTINENAIIQHTIKQQQHQQHQSNAIAAPRMMTGSSLEPVMDFIMQKD